MQVILAFTSGCHDLRAIAKKPIVGLETRARV